MCCQYLNQISLILVESKTARSEGHELEKYTQSISRIRPNHQDVDEVRRRQQN